MSNPLGPTLVVDAALPFDAFERALQEVGYARTGIASGPPLVPGEPEWAGYLRVRGEHPRSVTMTFHPVARLRQLDVSGEASAWREALAERLPLDPDGTVEAELRSGNPRVRLRGVLRAQEGERFDLAQPLAVLAVGDADPAVAGAASGAIVALDRALAARDAALAAAQVLADQVRPLVLDLAGPDGQGIVASLQPTAEDLAALFAADAVAEASLGAAQVWAALRWAPPGDRPHDVQIEVAPAGMFRSPGRVADRFPGGYRRIAHLLVPERVWVAWRYPAGHPLGGSLYDGLAWTGKRWVWLPKPFRWFSR